MDENAFVELGKTQQRVDDLMATVARLEETIAAHERVFDWAQARQAEAAGRRQFLTNARNAVITSCITAPVGITVGILFSHFHK